MKAILATLALAAIFGGPAAVHAQQFNSQQYSPEVLRELNSQARLSEDAQARQRYYAQQQATIQEVQRGQAFQEYVQRQYEKRIEVLGR